MACLLASLRLRKALGSLVLRKEDLVVKASEREVLQCIWKREHSTLQGTKFGGSDLLRMFLMFRLLLLLSYSASAHLYDLGSAGIGDHQTVC
jgi:hypothetical protein